MARCKDFGGRRHNGDPCEKSVCVGKTRCYLHGGDSPAAKIKSEQMLAQARLPACEALFEIIENWQRDRCATCGYPSGDTGHLKTIIRAAQVILDRSGLGPRSTVEVVKPNEADLDLSLLTEIELSQLDGLLDQIKILKLEIKTRLGLAPPSNVQVQQPSKVM